MDSCSELLPIQFSVDPGNNEEEVTAPTTEINYSDSINLLNEYLDIARFDPQVNV